MQVDGRSVEFKIKPASYPLIKIYLKEKQEDALETEVTFPKEFWIDLANTCKEATTNMGVFNSQKIAAGLNLMSRTILGEIAAEELRIRNKEAYEAFVDFIVETNNRSDLDKVHKGQLIHDRACQLQLQP